MSGFPILALTILSGLMFWVAYEMRIEATMTILYAVSALYIGQRRATCSFIACLN